MQISLNWLKNYVSLKASPEALARELTMAGLEVKGKESLNGDTLFEIEVTPNRPDCLNYLGIARETAAVLGTSLKFPKSKTLKPTKAKTNIVITDKEGCSRYLGAVIRNVSVKSSPGWLVKQLSSAGRSINNIVDITNFSLLENGQPLHAFDYDKLIGGKIIVRRAKEGEKIVTLDGVERKLNPSILVIADEKRAVAIAGVMGGKDTEVTEKTKNVLLESAYFDPVLIRRAGRALGLSSDSSYRFERGVDIEGVKPGLERAASLILKEAGGTLSSLSDVYPKKSALKREVIMQSDKIEQALGTKMNLTQVRAALQRLGFKISSKGRALKILIPSFRADVKDAVDMIEEIARLTGYDKIPTSIPLIKPSFIPENRNRRLREKIKELLCAQGLNEAICYSTLSKEDLRKSNLDAQDILSVQNPLTSEEEIMRPSLLPSLLSAVLFNINHGQKDFAFFEVGKIYLSRSVAEKETLGIIVTGRGSSDWRKGTNEEADFYDLKGIAEETLRRVGVQGIEFHPETRPFFDKSQSAGIYFKGSKLGSIGRISDEVLGRWDIKQKNVFFAEMDLEAVYAQAKPERKYMPLSGYPAIIRDLSLAVKKEIPFDDLQKMAREMIPEFLIDVKFVEQYVGEKIPQGYRGVTLSFVYQSSTRTLREEEVSVLHESFAKNAVERLGAIRR